MVRNPERAIHGYRYYRPTFGTSDLLVDRYGNTRDKLTNTDFGIDHFVPEKCYQQHDHLGWSLPIPS